MPRLDRHRPARRDPRPGEGLRPEGGHRARHARDDPAVPEQLGCLRTFVKHCQISPRFKYIKSNIWTNVVKKIGKRFKTDPLFQMVSNGDVEQVHQRSADHHPCRDARESGFISLGCAADGPTGPFHLRWHQPLLTHPNCQID